MTPNVSEVFLRAQSDERLVALARRGHHQAFVAIVARYERELLGFARRCGPEARAEDVVQQALLNAFVALRNGTEVTHLRGWLHVIVRRASARAAAVHAPIADGDLETAQTEPLEDLVLRRAQARDTLAAVNGLPERQREALLATVIKGRSRADIARDLGQSEGVVRQLVHRARVNVRSAVGSVIPFPVLRWLSALCGDSPAGAGTADATATATVLTSTGLASKLGVVLASSVLASGVVATGAVVLPGGLAGSGGRHEPAATHRRPAPARPVTGARAGTSAGGPAASAVAAAVDNAPRPAVALAARQLISGEGQRARSGGETRSATLAQRGSSGGGGGSGRELQTPGRGSDGSDHSEGPGVARRSGGSSGGSSRGSSSGPSSGSSGGSSSGRRGSSGSDGSDGSSGSPDGGGQTSGPIAVAATSSPDGSGGATRGGGGSDLSSGG